MLAVFYPSTQVEQIERVALGPSFDTTITYLHFERRRQRLHENIPTLEYISPPSREIYLFNRYAQSLGSSMRISSLEQQSRGRRVLPYSASNPTEELLRRVALQRAREREAIALARRSSTPFYFRYR